MLQRPDQNLSARHLSALSLSAADFPLSLNCFSDSSPGKLPVIPLLPTLLCHIPTLKFSAAVSTFLKPIFLNLEKKKNPPLCSPGGYNSPLASLHLISDTWMKQHKAAASAVPEGTIPFPYYLDNGCSTRSIKRRKWKQELIPEPRPLPKPRAPTIAEIIQQWSSALILSMFIYASFRYKHRTFKSIACHCLSENKWSQTWTSINKIYSIG